MPITKRIITLAALSLFVTGCSHVYGPDGIFYDQNTSYRQATATAPMQIPAGLSNADFTDDYPVPNIAYAHGSAVNIVPPGSLEDRVQKGEVPKSALKQKAPTPNAKMSTTNTNTPPSAVTAAQLNLNLAGQLQGQTLVLTQTFDQAWDNVGNALPGADYRIIQQNKKLAIYYILDISVTKERVTKDTPLYQVHVRASAANMTEVYVTDNNQHLVADSINTEILTNLNNALAGKLRNEPSLFQKLLRKL